MRGGQDIAVAFGIVADPSARTSIGVTVVQAEDGSKLRLFGQGDVGIEPFGLGPFGTAVFGPCGIKDDDGLGGQGQGKAGGEGKQGNGWAHWHEQVRKSVGLAYPWRSGMAHARLT